MSSYELMGSLGYVPPSDDSEGCEFVSATGGYRYTANSGFIFRVAAAGALFIGDESSTIVPFVQLGIGYGF